MLAARSLNTWKSPKVFPRVTFTLYMLECPLAMTQFLPCPRIKIIQRNDFLPVTLGSPLLLWRWPQEKEIFNSGCPLTLEKYGMYLLFGVQELGIRLLVCLAPFGKMRGFGICGRRNHSRSSLICRGDFPAVNVVLGKGGAS